MAKRRGTGARASGGSSLGRRPRTVGIGAARGRRRTPLIGVAAVAALFVVGVALAGTIGARPAPTAQPPGASVLPAPGFPTADPDGNYPAIGTIGCGTADRATWRAHSHLQLRFGGEIRPVPGSVGVRERCRYWLHTKEADGIVHLHGPTEHAVTLGDFFDVWGQVLTERQVVDRALEPTEGLYVFVDGERREGDPRAVPLGDLQAIELQVGTAPFQPLDYSFPSVFE